MYSCYSILSDKKKHLLSYIIVIKFNFKLDLLIKQNYDDDDNNIEKYTVITRKL